jgi:hypothetical protein
MTTQNKQTSLDGRDPLIPSEADRAMHKKIRKSSQSLNGQGEELRDYGIASGSDIRVVGENHPERHVQNRQVAFFLFVFFLETERRGF